MKKYCNTFFVLLLPIIIGIFSMVSLARPEKASAQILDACYDLVGIPTGKPSTSPYGWWYCNPSTYSCSNAFPHCTANDPGTDLMTCENRCPDGYYNWGSVGSCAACNNQVYDCRRTPPCTPNYTGCRTDGNGLRTGMSYDVNSCGGGDICNTSQCNNSGTSMCSGGQYYGYNGVCQGPVYSACLSVSGNVFNDVNKNLKQDPGESTIGGPIGISHSFPGASVTTSGGTYTISNIKPGNGNGTVSFDGPPPSGFTVLQSSFGVQVGGGCNVGASRDGQCDGNGNITSLNFPITNSNPWLQTFSGDVRIDKGVNDQIPSTAACTPNPPSPNPSTSYSALGINTSYPFPGVVFSGNSPYSFGQGTVSVTNWLAGGTTYHEVFPDGQLATSYTTLLNTATSGNVQVTDLSTVSGCTVLNACSLPNNLASGIYKANSDVTLVSDFKANPNSSYIFLINRDLTIKAQVQIQAPSGSDKPATVLFSAARNILVDRTVGANSNACPIQSQGQLEGFYSADQNFQVQGYNDCVNSTNSEKMLNMDGSIVVNAARLGGTFLLQRDLCGSNPTTPAFTIIPRLDLILRASTFLSKQQTISQEEAP